MPNQTFLFLAVWLVGMVVMIYFMFIVPGKKKNAQVRQLHESVKAGDEIITIGGIIGKVIERDGEEIQ